MLYSIFEVNSYNFAVILGVLCILYINEKKIIKVKQIRFFICWL